MTFDTQFIEKSIFNHEYGYDMMNTPEENALILADAKIAGKKVEDSLTTQQRAFVQKAIDEGFEDNIRFLYSGRGMYGKTCPAVILHEGETSDFGFKGASSDGMGKGIVIYLR